MEILQMLLLSHQTTGTLLPRAYQQVEYIESTGEQYINSNLAFRDYPQFEVKFKGTTSPIYNVCGVIGIQAKYGARIASIRASGTNDVIVGYYGLYYCYLYSPHDSWHEVSLKMGNAVMDGTEKTFSNDFNATSRTIILFGVNNNLTYELSPVQIARCRIYKGKDNPELVRDFVPCYRKKDGVIGMYDLCDTTGNPFYTNSGTGEFLKGDDV